MRHVLGHLGSILGCGSAILAVLREFQWQFRYCFHGIEAAMVLTVRIPKYSEPWLVVFSCEALAWRAYSEGPDTQYLRTSVPKKIVDVGFKPEILNDS